MDNLKRVRPTSFLGVPRVWEKIAEKIQETGKSNKGLKKMIGDWAKSAATKHHTMVREGKINSDQANWSYRMAQKLIFRYTYVFHFINILQLHIYKQIFF